MDLELAYRSALRMERAGNYAGAIEVWRDVLSEDPTLALAHAMLSRALLSSKRLRGAESEAKAALALDPQSAQAMLTLATAKKRTRAISATWVFGDMGSRSSP